jgi:hypothetical protein
MTRKSAASSTSSSLDALLETRPSSTRESASAPLADLALRPASSSSRALRSSVAKGSGSGGGFSGGVQGEQQPVRAFFSSDDNLSSVEGFSKPPFSNKPSKNLDYQLVLVTARDITDRQGICGGIIKSTNEEMCAKRGCVIGSHSKKHGLLQENRIFLESASKKGRSFVLPSTYNYTVEYENDAAVDLIHSVLDVCNYGMNEPMTLMGACRKFNEFVDDITEALEGDERDHELKLVELKEAIKAMGISDKKLKARVNVEKVEDEDISELGDTDAGGLGRSRTDLIALTERVQDQSSLIDKLMNSVNLLTNDLSEAKDKQRAQIVTSTQKILRLQEEVENLNDLTPPARWCQSIETKLYNLETGNNNEGSNDTNTDLIKSDLQRIRYEMTLLKERGNDSIEVGDIKIRSVAESFLFVNDHVKTCSFSCFHDFMCLLDSLRSTDIESSEYVKSEHDAMKSKLLDVNEVYISASFGHLAPLPFCRKSGATDLGATGSLGRSLPLVKDRNLWYSMGGTIGLKKTMTKDIAGRVASLKTHIKFSLGDSLGAELALSYLDSSHTCWKEFVAWTEDFYSELTGTSEVEEKEAWELILHCWMGFFNDLRDVRRECSSISATGLDLHSNARKEVVGHYIWTLGRAIEVQNEYLAKDFRNHPTISGVINYHLFLHRTPSTAFKKQVKKHDDLQHNYHDFKGKVERRLKKLEDRT